MPMLLVVDDNARVAESLSKVLEPAGYFCKCVRNIQETIDTINVIEIDAVLLDLMLGKEDGMDCLQMIREENPSLPVIMITGFATVDNAVRSMKLGAYDFIQKPLDVKHLLKILENAVKMKQLAAENQDLRNRMEELSPRPTAESNSMRDLLIQASKVATTELPVLIRGENGTGKELLADYVHAKSARSAKPFLKINCAAFPESLLDNELFGHERGSYTGATTSFQGIFERSNGGTLLLDEVGDMPSSIQAKILRVLQNSELRRIGGSNNVKIDVRFIAATNQNLDLLMQRGDFRQDLYFRLNAVTLTIPPLRERPQDIPVLARRFLDEFNKSTSRAFKTISPGVMGILLEYKWPGNVRELKNTVMYACSMASSPTILITDLPPMLSLRKTGSTASASTNGGKDPLWERKSTKGEAPSMGIGFSSKYGRDPRSEAEADIIRKMLDMCEYNKKMAAERLNMSRNTLYKKIAQYGISKDNV